MSAADLIDTEHLAELLKGGDGAAAMPEQLAELGKAHLQLLARLREVADSAQILALDLDEAQRHLRVQRAINAMHRYLISSNKLREPAAQLEEHQLIDLMVDGARHLGGQRWNALLIGATVCGCLHTADPASALGEVIAVITTALDNYRKAAARRAARGATA